MTKQTKPQIVVGDNVAFHLHEGSRSVSVESLSMASADVRSGHLMVDFNYFLLQIAHEIKSDELAEMKFLCDLPRGKLEQITKPTELLNILSKSDKIRPGEVMYLVTLLERVGLVKLAGEVMEQGKTSKLLLTLKRLSLLEVMWS